MSLSINGDVDPALRAAVKVLNSSTQSAEKIRLMLDDLIKARYGPSKMLINTLNKKYLAEEQPAPPIVTTSSSDDSNSMEVAYDPPTAVSSDNRAENSSLKELEENSLKELEELFCATCGDVHTSIRNQLVECCDCHLLYHQDCHKPPITDADAQTEWQCHKCRSTVPPAESVLTSSSSSSSSPTVFATKTSSSSSPHSSSSSSKSGSHKKGAGGGGGSGGGGGGGSSGGTATSGSGILSADKRLANMKKKAAKMQKTK